MRAKPKTTIVRALAHALGGTYLTLDDVEVLAAARADPASVLRGAREPIVIDEFQRVPELLLATKALVDRNRKPGRVILTGSTRFMSLPRLSETLAGRAAILELWPFSVGETLPDIHLVPPSPWCPPSWSQAATAATRWRATLGGARAVAFAHAPPKHLARPRLAPQRPSIARRTSPFPAPACDHTQGPGPG